MEKVQTVLREGFLLAVVGWRPSNHSAFTSRMPETKVQFFFRLPRALPQRVGLVIFTRFIGHREFEQARKWRQVHPIPLQIGEIKQILLLCKDLLFAPHTAKEEKTREAAHVTPSRPPEKKEPVLVSVPTPANSALAPRAAEIDIDKEFEFAKAFLKAAGPDPDTRLGKTTVGKLIREFLGDETSVPELVRQGWLTPFKAAGKSKVGWYKAGSRMLEANTEPEPKDPVARAKWIIAHEADLLEKRQEFEAKLSRINIDLEKINQARELLKRLEELMK